MKKKTVKHSKKILPKKIVRKKSPKTSFKWQFVLAAIALVIVGYFVFKQNVQKADINMIAPPAYVPVSCGVSDLQLMGTCGDNMFSSATTTCADGSIVKSDLPSSCKNAADWYTFASDKCANKCMSTPPPIASESAKPITSPVPSGCFYQAVQCIKAPCDPVLVCTVRPTSTPTSIACAQEVGMCASNLDSSCVTYTDSCQKNSLCATPFVTCRQQFKR